MKKNECILLLSRYWILHKGSLDYEVLSRVLFYLIKTDLISENVKRNYLYILYSNLSCKSYFCFLSYLCYKFYIDKRTDYLTSPLLFKFNNIDKFEEKICLILTSEDEKIQLLDINNDEDFGVYKEERMKEFYKETLCRLLKK